MTDLGSAARETILASIRRALDRTPAREDRERLDAELEKPALRRFRFREPPDPADLVENLLGRASSRGITCELASSLAELPALIDRYLRSERLALEIRVAPHPALLNVPWKSATDLIVRTGRPEASDPVGVTWVSGGIVETGSFVVSSGPETPHALAFLPPTVFLVLQRANVFPTMEDYFDFVRTARLPRVFTVVSNCATTGDIESVPARGPHGPGKVHAILVG